MFVTFLVFLLLVFAACVKIILWVHQQNKRRKETQRRRWPLDDKS